MRRFYVDAIAPAGELLTLSPEESRHLSRVLRLQPGDAVLLAAPDGGRAEASVVCAGPGNAVLRVTERMSATRAPDFSLDMAQGLLKAGKMDDLIRSCVELGVRRFIGVAMDRSVSRPDENRAREKRARWEKIAREAVKQCGREDEPEVAPVLAFAELSALAASYDLAVFFYEEKKGPLVLPRQRPRSVLAVLGPEGGFTTDEARELAGAGFVAAGLGPRTLRAETACLAAASLLSYLFGDMGPGE